jgi:hypothetical protein
MEKKISSFAGKDCSYTIVTRCKIQGLQTTVIEIGISKSNVWKVHVKAIPEKD